MNTAEHVGPHKHLDLGRVKSLEAVDVGVIELDYKLGSSIKHS